jgi:hypothetical protein
MTMTQEELEQERTKIYKAFCGRDYMHLPLYEALEVVFKEDRELRDELLGALENADKLITQLMPGVKHIALQDYGFLNDTLLANTAAIRKAKGETK